MEHAVDQPIAETISENTSTIVFTSDIHLSAKTPAISQAFLQFCDEIFLSAPNALYILGDLFNTWIGDDDISAYNKQVIAALKKISSNNITDVFLLVGNRDFLLGDDFATAANLTIIDDETLIEIGINNYKQRVLLCHGDQLCTDDVDYQAFRSASRTTEWQRKVLSKPLWQRRLISRVLRYRSIKAQSKKTLDIMDVNEQAVLDAFAKYKVRTMIHGHTHRPKEHRYNEKTRWVLDAWHHAANSLWVSSVPDKQPTFELRWKAFGD